MPKPTAWSRQSPAGCGDMGLPTDTVVGIQLPNIVESILATLAVLRAGMIVAPLPLLCRRADAVAALARVGAKALITCGRVGAFDHGQFAMRRGGGRVFHPLRVRLRKKSARRRGVVRGFVHGGRARSGPTADRERRSNAAAHVAAITFDVGEGGIVPVARSHAELLAGGLAVLLEGRLAQDANILSTIAPSSFAGICLTLVALAALRRHARAASSVRLPAPSRVNRATIDAATLILPGPVAFRLAPRAPSPSKARHASSRRGVRRSGSRPARPGAIRTSTLSTFRSSAKPRWRRRAATPTAGRARCLLGPILAPRGSAGRSRRRRIDANRRRHRRAYADRWCRTIRFRPGSNVSGLPYFKIGPRRRVDTRLHLPHRFRHRGDRRHRSAVRHRQRRRLSFSAPRPSGASSAGSTAPQRSPRCRDPIVGQRLIGNAADRDTMQAALNAVGVNPLVVAAFRDRAADRGRPARIRPIALTGR